MKPREIVETILFLPAMAILAGVVFAACWLVIRAGNAAVHAWFAALRGVGLPSSAALALATILAAVTVYGALYWLGRQRLNRRLRSR